MATNTTCDRNTDIKRFDGAEDFMETKVKLKDGRFGYVFSKEATDKNSWIWKCHMCDVSLVDENCVDVHIASSDHEDKMKMDDPPETLFAKIVEAAEEGSEHGQSGDSNKEKPHSCGKPASKDDDDGSTMQTEVEIDNSDEPVIVHVVDPKLTKQVRIVLTKLEQGVNIKTEPIDEPEADAELTEKIVTESESKEIETEQDSDDEPLIIQVIAKSRQKAKEEKCEVKIKTEKEFGDEPVNPKHRKGKTEKKPKADKETSELKKIKIEKESGDEPVFIPKKGKTEKESSKPKKVKKETESGDEPVFIPKKDKTEKESSKPKKVKKDKESSEPKKIETEKESGDEPVFIQELNAKPKKGKIKKESPKKIKKEKKSPKKIKTEKSCELQENETEKESSDESFKIQEVTAKHQKAKEEEESCDLKVETVNESCELKVETVNESCELKVEIVNESCELKVETVNETCLKFETNQESSQPEKTEDMKIDTAQESSQPEKTEDMKIETEQESSQPEKTEDMKIDTEQESSQPEKTEDMKIETEKTEDMKIDTEQESSQPEKTEDKKIETEDQESSQPENTEDMKIDTKPEKTEDMKIDTKPGKTEDMKIDTKPENTEGIKIETEKESSDEALMIQEVTAKPHKKTKEEEESCEPKNIDSENQSCEAKETDTEKESSEPKNIEAENESCEPKNDTENQSCEAKETDTEKESSEPKNIEAETESCEPINIDTENQSCEAIMTDTEKESSEPKNNEAETDSCEPKNIDTENQSCEAKETDTEKESSEPKNIEAENESCEPKNDTENQSCEAKETDTEKESSELKKIEAETESCEPKNIDMENQSCEAKETATKMESLEPKKIEAETEMCEQKNIDMENQSCETKETDTEKESSELKKIEAETESCEPKNIDVENQSCEAKDTDTKKESLELKNIEAETESCEQKNIDMENQSCETKETDTEKESLELKKTEAETESCKPKNIDTENQSCETKETDIEKESSEPKNIEAETESCEPKNIDTENQSCEAKETDIEKESSEPKNVEAETESCEPKNIDMENQSCKAKETDTEKESSELKKIKAETELCEFKRIKTEKESCEPKIIPAEKDSCEPNENDTGNESSDEPLIIQEIFGKQYKDEDIVDIADSDTEEDKIETETTSAGDKVQMESTGDTVQTKSTGGTVQTESTGDMVQTESTGDTVQMESTGDTVQTESTGDMVQTESGVPDIKEASMDGGTNKVEVLDFMNIKVKLDDGRIGYVFSKQKLFYKCHVCHEQLFTIESVVAHVNSIYHLEIMKLPNPPAGLFLPSRIIEAPKVAADSKQANVEAESGSKAEKRKQPVPTGNEAGPAGEPPSKKAAPAGTVGPPANKTGQPANKNAAPTGTVGQPAKKTAAPTKPMVNKTGTVGQPGNKTAAPAKTVNDEAFMEIKVKLKGGRMGYVFSRSATSANSCIWKCHLCDANLPDKKSVYVHVASNRHQENMNITNPPDTLFSKIVMATEEDEDDSGFLSQPFPPGVDDYQVAETPPAPPGVEGGKKPVTKFQINLDTIANTQPIVGMEYLIEVLPTVKGQNLSYICVLCDKVLNAGIGLSHIISIGHRKAYLIKHFPKLWEEMQSSFPRNKQGQKQQLGAIERVVGEIERKHGRLFPQHIVKEAELGEKKLEIVKKMETEAHLRETSSDTFSEAIKEDFVPAETNVTQVVAKKEEVEPMSLAVVPTKNSLLEAVLDTYHLMPVIGVEYMVEMKLEGNIELPRQYYCFLCDRKGDPNIVRNHIASFRHYIRYIERHFKETHKALSKKFPLENLKDKPKIAAMKTVTKVCAKIEELFGRLKPTVITEIQFEVEREGLKKLVTEDIHFWEPEGDKTFVDIVLKGESAVEISSAPLQAPEKGKSKLPTHKMFTDPSLGKNLLEMLNTEDRPLIGLEYLVELTSGMSNKEANFICTFCDRRGDPRVIMTHFTSYKHCLKYINKYFPTAKKAINYMFSNEKTDKRGIGEMIVMLCAKIEDRYGRQRPRRIDKQEFEKRKGKIVSEISNAPHVAETAQENFVEYIDRNTCREYFLSYKDMEFDLGEDAAQPVESTELVLYDRRLVANENFTPPSVSSVKAKPVQLAIQKDKITPQSAQQQKPAQIIIQKDKYIPLSSIPLPKQMPAQRPAQNKKPTPQPVPPPKQVPGQRPTQNQKPTPQPVPPPKQVPAQRPTQNQKPTPQPVPPPKQVPGQRPTQNQKPTPPKVPPPKQVPAQRPTQSEKPSRWSSFPPQTPPKPLPAQRAIQNKFNPSVPPPNQMPVQRTTQFSEQSYNNQAHTLPGRTLLLITPSGEQTSYPATTTQQQSTFTVQQQTPFSSTAVQQQTPYSSTTMQQQTPYASTTMQQPTQYSSTGMQQPASFMPMTISQVAQYPPPTMMMQQALVQTMLLQQSSFQSTSMTQQTSFQSSPVTVQAPFKPMSVPVPPQPVQPPLPTEPPLPKEPPPPPPPSTPMERRKEKKIPPAADKQFVFPLKQRRCLVKFGVKSKAELEISKLRPEDIPEERKPLPKGKPEEKRLQSTVKRMQRGEPEGFKSNPFYDSSESDDDDRGGKSGSHTNSALVLTQRWEYYTQKLTELQKTLKEEMAFFISNPEKHPEYKSEWAYWCSKCKRRDEWVPFWSTRMQQIYEKNLKERSDQLRENFKIGKSPEPETSKRKRSRTPSPDEPRRKRSLALLDEPKTDDPRRSPNPLDKLKNWKRSKSPDDSRQRSPSPLIDPRRRKVAGSPLGDPRRKRSPSPLDKPRRKKAGRRSQSPLDKPRKRKALRAESRRRSPSPLEKPRRRNALSPIGDPRRRSPSPLDKPRRRKGLSPPTLVLDSSSRSSSIRSGSRRSPSPLEKLRRRSRSPRSPSPLELKRRSQSPLELKRRSRSPRDELRKRWISTSQDNPRRGSPTSSARSGDRERKSPTPFTRREVVKKPRTPEKSPERRVTIATECVGLLSVLRLLTALESQLESMGPKVNALLTSALSFEKINPGASNCLLGKMDNALLLETLKEKLRGRLLAGIVEPSMIAVTEKCVAQVEELLQDLERRPHVYSSMPEPAEQPAPSFMLPPQRTAMSALSGNQQLDALALVQQLAQQGRTASATPVNQPLDVLELLQRLAQEARPKSEIPVKQQQETLPFVQQMAQERTTPALFGNQQQDLLSFIQQLAQQGRTTSALPANQQQNSFGLAQQMAEARTTSALPVNQQQNSFGLAQQITEARSTSATPVNQQNDALALVQQIVAAQGKTFSDLSLNQQQELFALVQGSAMQQKANPSPVPAPPTSTTSDDSNQCQLSNTDVKNLVESMNVISREEVQYVMNYIKKIEVETPDRANTLWEMIDLDENMKRKLFPRTAKRRKSNESVFPSLYSLQRSPAKTQAPTLMQRPMPTQTPAPTQMQMPMQTQAPTQMQMPMQTTMPTQTTMPMQKQSTETTEFSFTRSLASANEEKKNISKPGTSQQMYQYARASDVYNPSWNK